VSEDLNNCILAISNLLKGRSQNCLYFLEKNGPKKLMECLLAKDCSIEVVEMCMSGIKHFAD